MESTATTATPEAPTTTTAEARALILTPAAVAQVKTVMKEQGFEGHVLTVRVVPAGCSGLGYDLNLLKDAKAGDVVWEQDGVRIATDPMSVQYLGGTEVDYLVTDTEAGFKFKNPNAKSTCGCGSSFST